MVSPRWFHKVNVTAVRVTNLPILLVIGWYDRHYLWRQAKAKPYQHQKPHSFWDFSRFSVHGDIQAVFDTDPPEYIYDDDSDVEDSGFERPRLDSNSHGNRDQHDDQDFRAKRLRKGSNTSVVGLTEQLSDMLHEHRASSIKERLEKLEASNERIELLLRKLCEDEIDGVDKVDEAVVEEYDDVQG